MPMHTHTPTLIYKRQLRLTQLLTPNRPLLLTVTLLAVWGQILKQRALPCGTGTQANQRSCHLSWTRNIYIYFSVYFRSRGRERKLWWVTGLCLHFLVSSLHLPSKLHTQCSDIQCNPPPHTHTHTPCTDAGICQLHHVFLDLFCLYKSLSLCPIGKWETAA